MGYRRVKSELLWAIYTRSRAGASNRAIGRVLGLDKKTVNDYVTKMGDLELPEDLSYPEQLERLSQVVKRNDKPRPAHDIFLPLIDEIRYLLGGDKEKKIDPMKSKTAWEVISRRHELPGKTSYESFKRFIRTHGLTTIPVPAVPRIETEPGEEVQIDYGRVGKKEYDKRYRVVNAYCGTLSASRLPYIQFCLHQDTVSFTQSTAAMFSFYGGVPKRINLDNLKSGVLSADIYDPILNRSFAELCEHYGVIADPARAGAPKDKGKIERLVPVARELYRRLNALYPDASLDELNRHALIWCRDEYGKRKHGTTGIPPIIVFEEIEKACLIPLPAAPFIPARWLTAKVHPDQFIQAKGTYYGLPAQYIGRQVVIRITPSLVTIYYEHTVVRQYPTSNKRRVYLPEDFPAYAQPFKPGSYAAFLVKKAYGISAQAGSYIQSIIESGGNLSLRRAQGCLALIEKHRCDRGLSHVLGMAHAERIAIPDRLRVLFEAEAAQNVLPFVISETGRAMTRGADYYTGP
jgi:transposase